MSRSLWDAPSAAGWRPASDGRRRPSSGPLPCRERAAVAGGGMPLGQAGLDLQLAVQSGPAVPGARHRDEGPGRGQRRHDVCSRGRRQLRAQGAAGQGHPLPPRPRVPGRGHEALGRLGTRRDRGRQGGRPYADPDLIHPADHDGEFFSVAEPLPVPAGPQGRPVIVQAGGSEGGLALGAEFADVVFTVAQTQARPVAFRDDIRARAAAAGRDPDRVRRGRARPRRADPDRGPPPAPTSAASRPAAPKTGSRSHVTTRQSLPDQPRQLNDLAHPQKGRTPKPVSGGCMSKCSPKSGRSQTSRSASSNSWVS
jgi:hypothetical protein